MTRKVKISSTIALILVCTLLAIWSVPSTVVDPRIKKILGRPGIVENYRMDQRNIHGRSEISPLVRQAKLYAEYLNPPRTEENPAESRSKSAISNAKAETSAASQKYAYHTPKFKLHGTCYYPSQPEASVALVWQPGGGGGTFTWVKRGAQLGHFVVEEVKRSAIVYGIGKQKNVMEVKNSPSRSSLARSRSNSAEPKYTEAPTVRPVAVRGNRFLPEVGNEETTEEDVSGKYGPMPSSFTAP